MQIHPSAKTTPKSRLELVRRVEAGQRVQAVAMAFGVSRATVYKWLRRWREHGATGLDDRSSAPRRCPHRTPIWRERQIGELRQKRWPGWRIARRLRMALSTVSAVLRRLCLGRLPPLEPPAPIVRYERERPGELLHLDVKKLGRIKGFGHRVTGVRQHRSRGVGWEYAYVAIDDHSRLAYVEVLDGLDGPSALAFAQRAIAWFRALGVTTERIMTDNDKIFLTNALRAFLAERSIRHLRTRPYTPRTNGKAERFIQTLMRDWAYRRPYRTSAERRLALPSWLRRYNHQRPHHGLGMNTPIQRLRSCLQPT